MWFRKIIAAIAFVIFTIGVNAQINELPDSLQRYFNSAKTDKDSMIAYHNAGVYYSQVEYNITNSLNALYKALRFSEEIGDNNLRPQILRSIAYAYQAQGDSEKSQEFYLKAILLLKSEGKRAEEAEVYAYLGEMMEEQGRVEKALRYYSQVDEITEQIGYDNSKAQSLNAIARMNLMKGDYARTIEFYMEAADRFREKDNYRWLAYIYSQLAQVCINIGGFAQAIEFAENGLKIATDRHLVKETYDNYLALSDIYNAMEDYPKALRYYKLYNSLRDSLFTAESRQNIQELEQRIIQEQKQKQIQLLEEKAQVQELKANRQLLVIWSLATGLAVIIMIIIIYYNRYRLRQKHSVLLQNNLKEKETMLQEIHHRIKNNLQLVSSLLNLQSANIEDEKAKELIVESKNRVQSMALVHQKLFQSEDRENVGFRDYLFLLVENVEHSYTGEYDKINFEINCPDISFNLDTAIPLGLIVNELLTNACKHAFKGKKTGTVSTVIKKSEEQYLLSVSDNGRGMPEGFDIENSQSLGLEIVKSLSEQLNGELCWENNNGASFHVSFQPQVKTK